MFTKEETRTIVDKVIDTTKIKQGDIIGFQIEELDNDYTRHYKKAVGQVTTVTPQGLAVYDLTNQLVRSISPVEVDTKHICLLTTTENLLGDYEYELH